MLPTSRLGTLLIVTLLGTAVADHFVCNRGLAAGGIGQCSRDPFVSHCRKQYVEIQATREAPARDVHRECEACKVFA